MYQVSCDVQDPSPVQSMLVFNVSNHIDALHVKFLGRSMTCMNSILYPYPNANAAVKS